MFENTFLKTLFEKRWMIFWWTLGSIATTILIVIFYPTLKDTFGQALQNVPESMRSFLGDSSDYQTLAGFINIQVYQQMIFFPVILGVILCTGLIGGDENDGTLQVLLAHPISRTKVYFHKLAASLTIVWIVTFGLFIGSWLGAILVHESLDLWRLFQATFMTWLVSMAISLIGFMLVAVMGRRAVAGSIVGAYAFVMYVISSLVTSVKGLRFIEHFSPFHYFNQPSPLKATFDFGDMLVLLVACAVFITIGYIIFTKRDVYQR